MNREAQRIEVAEARGWRIEKCDGKWADGADRYAVFNPDGTSVASTDKNDAHWLKWGCLLPDYPNDLNVALPLLFDLSCGWRLQSSYNGDRGCWVILSGPSHPYASDSVDIVVSGDTFAAAICEAYLRYMKNRKTESGTKLCQT